MKYKTLFRIICKAIGVYFFVLGVVNLLGTAGGVVAGFLMGTTIFCVTPH